VKLWPRVWCLVFLTHGVYAWPTWIRVSQKVREMSDYSGFLTSLEIGSTCVFISVSLFYGDCQILRSNIFLLYYI